MQTGDSVVIIKLLSVHYTATADRHLVGKIRPLFKAGFKESTKLLTEQSCEVAGPISSLNVAEVSIPQTGVQ